MGGSGGRVVCGALSSPRCGSWFIRGETGSEMTLRVQGHTGTSPRLLLRFPGPFLHCVTRRAGAPSFGRREAWGLESWALQAEPVGRSAAPPPRKDGASGRVPGGQVLVCTAAAGGEGAAQAATWAQALRLPSVSVSGATAGSSSASALLPLGPLRVGLGPGRGPFPESL